MIRLRAKALLCGTLALLLAACAAPATRSPPAASPVVDAHKLLGGWYLVAHVPYAEEPDQLDSSIELRPREDGGLDEIYHYFDGRLMQSVARQRGRYEVVPGSNNARWIDHSRARSSQMELSVLYVDPAYRYAVVGESQRHLGWIYARDPLVDPGIYAMLLARLDQQGYDVAQLHRLGHSQVLVGEPRFSAP
ncbi:MAG: lipocalin family protein [Nevskia sp.]|nr:lipocalin family protein [Nevskia sp.]